MGVSSIGKVHAHWPLRHTIPSYSGHLKSTLGWITLDAVFSVKYFFA
jgi:hypothetical protein